MENSNIFRESVVCWNSNATSKWLWPHCEIAMHGSGFIFIFFHRFIGITSTFRQDSTIFLFDFFALLIYS